MFYRLPYIREAGREKGPHRQTLPARLLGQGPGTPWSHFKKLSPVEEMLKLVSDRVFPQPVPDFRFD
jgi:hypothetical protein